eukprot:gene4788-3899_t
MLMAFSLYLMAPQEPHTGDKQIVSGLLEMHQIWECVERATCTPIASTATPTAQPSHLRTMAVAALTAAAISVINASATQPTRSTAELPQVTNQHKTPRDHTHAVLQGKWICKSSSLEVPDVEVDETLVAHYADGQSHAVRIDDTGAAHMMDNEWSTSRITVREVLWIAKDGKKITWRRNKQVAPAKHPRSPQGTPEQQKHAKNDSSDDECRMECPGPLQPGPVQSTFGITVQEKTTCPECTLNNPANEVQHSWLQLPIRRNTCDQPPIFAKHGEPCTNPMHGVAKVFLGDQAMPALAGHCGACAVCCAIGGAPCTLDSAHGTPPPSVASTPGLLATLRELARPIRAQLGDGGSTEESLQAFLADDPVGQSHERRHIPFMQLRPHMRIAVTPEGYAGQRRTAKVVSITGDNAELQWDTPSPASSVQSRAWWDGALANAHVMEDGHRCECQLPRECPCKRTIRTKRLVSDSVSKSHPEFFVAAFDRFAECTGATDAHGRSLDSKNLHSLMPQHKPGTQLPFDEIWQCLMGALEREACSEPNVRFYRGTGVTQPGNHRLRQLHKPVAKGGKNGDNGWLESDHSYIQWLFPTQQQGQNCHAIPLSDAEAAVFRADTRIQAALVKSFDVMLAFY